MAQIEQFLKEQRIARQADKVINATNAFLKNRSPILSKLFPVVERSGIDWLQYIVEETDPIASFVAPGQDYPLWQGNKFTKVLDRLPKASLGYVWNEDMIRKAKELGDYSSEVLISEDEIFTDLSQNRIDLNSSVDNQNTDHSKFENFVRYLFGSEIKLVNAHYNIIDILTYQLLQTGKISWTDYRTKRKITFDWRKVISSQYNHFPDVDQPPTYFTSDPRAIAGNPSRDWTSWGTADGLEDIQALAQAYRADSGTYPDVIMMSTELAYNLLRQESTKRAVQDARIQGEFLRGSPTLESVNQVLKTKGLPPITLNDDQFTLDELNTGNSTERQRFLDPTVFVFGKFNMGDRVFGDTVENNFKGGIFVDTVEKSKAPPADLTFSVSSPIAICTTISRTGGARKVTTKANLENTINLKDFMYSNP